MSDFVTKTINLDFELTEQITDENFIIDYDLASPVAGPKEDNLDGEQEPEE